jgi:hypothetical protein
MKKLISICLLAFLTVMCNAQEKQKSKYSDLNQDQLNLALTKSKKTIKTGKTLTFVGLGVGTTGILILMIEGLKAIEGDADGNTASAGAYIALASGFFIYTGVPVWIVGASKKKNIQFELAKFKTNGSASINGIGLKIRF